MAKFTARNFKGEECVFEVRGKPVMTAHGVTLIQVRKARYVVVYGMQVSKVLDYRLAAIELGQCLLHSLSCEGKLDE